MPYPSISLFLSLFSFFSSSFLPCALMSIRNSATSLPQCEVLPRSQPLVWSLWNGGLRIDHENLCFFGPRTPPEADPYGGAYPFLPFIHEQSNMILMMHPSSNPFTLQTNYEDNGGYLMSQQWSCEFVPRRSPEHNTPPLPSTEEQQMSRYYYNPERQTLPPTLYDQPRLQHPPQRPRSYQASEACHGLPQDTTTEFTSNKVAHLHCYTSQQEKQNHQQQQQQQQKQKQQNMQPSTTMSSSNIIIAQVYSNPSSKTTTNDPCSILETSCVKPIPAKQHICDYCEKAFARRHDMQRHTRLHTGAKPYRCPYCDLAFSRSDARTRHYKKDPVCYEKHQADLVDPK